MSTVHGSARALLLRDGHGVRTRHSTGPRRSAPRTWTAGPLRDGCPRHGQPFPGISEPAGHTVIPAVREALPGLSHRRVDRFFSRGEGLRNALRARRVVPSRRSSRRRYAGTAAHAARAAPAREGERNPLTARSTLRAQIPGSGSSVPRKNPYARAAAGFQELRQRQPSRAARRAQAVAPCGIADDQRFKDC